MRAIASDNGIFEKLIVIIFSFTCAESTTLKNNSVKSAKCFLNSYFCDVKS